MRPTLHLLAVAAMAAASGIVATGSADLVPPPPSSPPPEADTWVDWDAALASATAYAIREWSGQRFLVVQHQLQELDYAPMPDCFGTGGCSDPVAFPDHDGFPTAHGTTLRVVTPDGLCQPTLSDPVMLDTSGCAPSVTVARAIDDCGDAIAPIALAGTSLPDLTWHPRSEQRYELAEASISDAELRDWIDERLGDYDALSWDNAAAAEQSDAVRWDVELEHESVRTFAAGFQMVSPEDACSVVGVAWSLTALDGAGGLPGVSLATALDGLPWEGVLGFQDRVAAFVGRDRNEVSLLVRYGDGRLATATRLAYASDDPACDGPDMPGVYPAPCP